MADADFSGVLNPKRIQQKRLDAAEAASAPAPKPPASGAMSQTDFTKSAPVDKEKRAKALAEALRNRK